MLAAFAFGPRPVLACAMYGALCVVKQWLMFCYSITLCIKHGSLGIVRADAFERVLVGCYPLAQWLLVRGVVAMGRDAFVKVKRCADVDDASLLVADCVHPSERPVFVQRQDRA